MNYLLKIILITLSIINSLFANYCLNGKDPNTLTNKEYLIEFSKGNCSPVIIIPPLTGVRLYI